MKAKRDEKEREFRSQCEKVRTLLRKVRVEEEQNGESRNQYAELHSQSRGMLPGVK
jgi:hypothetical protein